MLCWLSAYDNYQSMHMVLDMYILATINLTLAVQCFANMRFKPFQKLDVSRYWVCYINTVWRYQHKKAGTNRKRICSQNMDNKGKESQEWLHELTKLRKSAIQKEYRDQPSHWIGR